MNFLKNFILLLFLNDLLNVSQSSNWKTRENKCVETLEFTNCKDGRKRIYRNHNLKITAAFKRCDKREYRFDFNFVDIDTGTPNEFLNNPSGPTLFLNKFSLKNGQYKVVLNVHTVTTDVSVVIDDCILTVEISPPIPVIEGGFERYIGEGLDILLNASRSKDFNSLDISDPNNFEYSWIYDCETCGGFITAPQKTAVFVIPGKQHRRDMTYLVKLGLKTKWSDEMYFVQQLTHVRKNSSGIEIICIANCNPPFHEGEMTLKAICTYHCPKEITWTWNIYRVPKEDELVINGTDWEFESTIPSDGSNIIEIDEDDFEYDTGYIASVNLNGNDETAANYKFITPPEYNFTCRIIPIEGVVLETKFTFKCKGVSYGTYFWVSSTVGDDREQILQYDSSWEYLSFTVPKIGAVHLRFTDYAGQEGYMSWNPSGKIFKLTVSKKKPEEIEKLYLEGNESVVSLLNDRDYIAAIDRMNLVSKNIASMEPYDFHKVSSVAETLIGDLKKIPIKDLANIEKAASIVADLTSMDLIYSPQYTSSFMSVCGQLAKNYRLLVKNDYLSGKTGDVPVHTTISYLMQCTSAGIRPNRPAIEEEDIEFDITTPVYLVEEGNLQTEYYEEYRDDDSAYHNKVKYMNVTQTFIDVCIYNGRVLLRRLKNAKAKFTDIVTSDSYTIKVVNKHGYKIVSAALHIRDIQLSFSKDLVDSEDIYTIIMCATSDDISWWQKTVEIVTDILIISIMHGKDIIYIFQKPFEITFTVTRRPILKYKPTETSIRMKHLTRDPEDDEEEQLSIYVISLKADHSLAIEFKNLEEHLILNVVSTTFELPEMANFKENMQIINKNFPFFLKDEVFAYDTFRLIAVIVSPLDERKKNVSFSFEMIAYAIACVKWQDEHNAWIPGCKPRFQDIEEIVCYCESLSTIASSIEDIPMKKWQDYIPMTVDLEEQIFLEASIFVLVIFLFYSVAICFSMKEEDPHVLNYPDPLMLILQRGEENWFLMATRENLGKITEIELWIDGVGSSPSWSCNSVSILDLQHRMWYRFKIRQTFTIYPKPKVHLKSKPLDEEHNLSSFWTLIEMMKKCFPGFQLFNFSLRQKDEHLSYFKRLTVMLSIWSSIAAWCIVIDGTPLRNPTDSIMQFCSYTFNFKVVINGIGGSITTAFYQLPIEYFFRTSRVQIPLHSFLQRSMKPLIFTFFCWMITTLIIICNLTFIVISGVWKPNVSSFMWMTEIVIGILFYIFVIDVVFSSCMKMVNMKEKLTQYIQRAYTHIMRDIENQRLILYRVFGKFLLRPFLQHLYTPLHGITLRVLWQIEKMRAEVKELIQNLITFLVYISLMYMVILANRDYRSVYSNKQIKNLIEGRSTRSFLFSDVVSVKTLEEYIEDTLIEVTQSKIWYGNYAVREPGMTADYANKLLGVVRLRQHRSKPRSCEIPEAMQFVNVSCNADYFKSHTQEDFDERWKKKKGRHIDGRMTYIWRFTPKNETGSSSFIGEELKIQRLKVIIELKSINMF